MGQYLSKHLQATGWEVLSPGEPATRPLSGMVFDAGLVGDATATLWPGAAEAFRAAVFGNLARFADPADGGARGVAIASRDWLGAPGYADYAAVSGGLVGVVRSLALELGRRGITINLVVGLADHDQSQSDSETESSALPPPVVVDPGSLLPWAVSPDDVAATVAFLVDPRSSHITGQVVYCCGGASLLSSLSA